MMFSKYDLHETMNLRPGELPFAKPPTPAAMRVGLARAQYYSTIVCNVSVMAEREGWSGEDKYTALAFYAMLQLESTTATYLRFSNSVLNKPLFMSVQQPELSGK